MNFLQLYSCCFFNILCFATFAQTEVVKELQHDGIVRSYTLYVPASYENSSDVFPLVFNFHGFGSNALEQQIYSGMSSVADTANFIVCYPNGVGAAWNVGWAFGSTEDDVGFTDKMIDAISAEYRIKEGQVYACGMSNGGFFSYYLACNLPNKIAAIASVTGSMLPEQIEICSPSKAMPAMQIHGTNDLIVPYNGSAGVAAPIEDVISFWVENNACIADLEVFEYPDIDVADGSTASKFSYGNCNEGADVEFIVIENGGHTWPGALINIGVTNQDFNASSEIWNFFNQHTLVVVADVEDIQVADLAIVYPNPSDGNVRVELYESAVLSVYSSLGELVLRRNMEGAEKSFQLDPGHYTFVINSKNRKQVERVVVF